MGVPTWLPSHHEVWSSDPSVGWSWNACVDSVMSSLAPSPRKAASALLLGAISPGLQSPWCPGCVPFATASQGRCWSNAAGWTPRRSPASCCAPSTRLAGRSFAESILEQLSWSLHGLLHPLLKGRGRAGLSWAVRQEARSFPSFPWPRPLSLSVICLLNCFCGWSVPPNMSLDFCYCHTQATCCSLHFYKLYMLLPVIFWRFIFSVWICFQTCMSIKLPLLWMWDQKKMNSSKKKKFPSMKKRLGSV